MVDNLLKTQAFKLKGRLYTLTVLQLLTHDKTLFSEQLDEVIAQAPKLFENTGIVLDCSLVQEPLIKLEEFYQSLCSRNMFPVAIQSDNPSYTAFARKKGMAVLNASATHDKPLVEVVLEASTPEPALTLPTKLITTPVRSGQQVVSKGGDLVVVGPVSHGAELLADGNIHVYGPLRGRVLAGISGDKSARIFCQSLEAQLISIAGFYRLSEATTSHAGACQIYLQDEHICIESLC